jgi:hypothetical protein
MQLIGEFRRIYDEHFKLPRRPSFAWARQSICKQRHQKRKKKLKKRKKDKETK